MQLAKRAIMTDLYIHIGAPKTGTTAIQHHLLKNRDILARQYRILYPRGGLLGAGHHIIGAAVFPERSYRLQGLSREDALQRSLHDVRMEIEESKPCTVILSTEYLWGELSADNIRRLLNPLSHCKIKVVAYLRRQDLLAQSLYVQAVKGGLADPFSVWLERVASSGRAGFDFHKVLTAWMTTGIPTEVIVRVYEKSQLRNDICSDFLATVSSQEISLPSASSQVVNPGPDRATVELLRLVSGKLKDPKLGAIVRKKILSNSASRALFAPLHYLPSNEAASFMSRFAEVNARVARDFIKRPDGRLFEETSPASGSSPNEEVDSADLLRRIIDLLPVLLAAPEAGPLKAKAGKQDKRNAATQASSGHLGI